MGVDNPDEHVHVAHHAGGEVAVGGGDRVEVGHVQQDEAAGSGAHFAASADGSADAVEESGSGFGYRVGCRYSPGSLATLGSVTFGGERLSLRVDALVDAEPVEQLFAAFCLPDCRLHGGGGRSRGRGEGNVLPCDGVEEGGFAAAGRTEEADDRVLGGEFAALAEAFEGFGGVEQDGLGDSSFAVADGFLEGCDGAREGRGRHAGGGASLGIALSVLEFVLGGSHSAFFFAVVRGACPEWFSGQLSR